MVSGAAGSGVFSAVTGVLLTSLSRRSRYKFLLPLLSFHHSSFRCVRNYSGSQCSWAASGAPTLGKDEKGTATPGKPAQGRQTVRGPIPLHNAVVRLCDVCSVCSPLG